jgi:protein-S-isoprenylcysteine O-methyltransferase Ste14
VPTRRATWLPLAAVVANGLLVGASLDQSIKQLPARHRLGVTASAADLVLQLGVVTGLVPWWLTGWRVRHPAPPRAWAPLRVAGAALLATGAVVPVHAFLRFVVEGVGSPAPIAPTQQPVVGGPYRYVRNPMYLAVVAVIIGQALALGQPGLLAYAAAVGGATAAFAQATRSRPCAASSAPSTRPTGGPCPPGGHAATPGHPGRPPATKRDRCHG